MRTKVPTSVVLKPHSTTDVEVKFRPLVLVDKEASLIFKSPDLGDYEWRLHLKSVPTGPERGIEFSVPLGSGETKKFRFTNWFEGKTEYTAAFKVRRGLKPRDVNAVVSNEGADLVLLRLCLGDRRTRAPRDSPARPRSMPCSLSRPAPSARST